MAISFNKKELEKKKEQKNKNQNRIQIINFL